MSRWLGLILLRSLSLSALHIKGQQGWNKARKTRYKTDVLSLVQKYPHWRRLVNPNHSVCHCFNPALSDPMRAPHDQCAAAAQSSTPYCHDDMRGFNIFCWINTVTQTAGVWPNLKREASEACNSFLAPLEKKNVVCVCKKMKFTQSVLFLFTFPSFSQKHFSKSSCHKYD